MNILTVNLLFSTLIFWIASRIYILPGLQRTDATERLVAYPAVALPPKRPISGMAFNLEGTVDLLVAIGLATV